MNKTFMIIRVIFIVIICFYFDNMAYSNGDKGLYEDEFYHNNITVSNYTDNLVSKSLFDISPFHNNDYFVIDETRTLKELGENMYLAKINFQNNEEKFLIWKKVNKRCIPLWVFDDHWEMNKFRWIDFNNDKKKDLLLYIGHEDSAASYIYINNISKTEFSEDNFILVYSKDDEYVNIIDIDGDGVPEILENSEPTLNTEIYNGEIEEPEILNKDIPDSIAAKIKKEHKKICGMNEKLYFDYNMYNMPQMRLFEKVNILKVDDFEIKDITGNCKRHINWRISILNKLKPMSTTEGKDIIHKTILYLNNKINDM